MKSGMMLGLTVLTAAAAWAGPLKKTDIPAGSVWAAHLDLETLRSGDVGRFLLKQFSEGQDAAHIDALNAILNFDIRKDLNDVTLFGRAEGDTESVAILRGRLDTERLVLFVRANDTHTEKKVGDQTIHSWVDKDKQGQLQRSFGCVPAPGVLVVGKSEARLCEALDTLAGRRPPLQDGFLDEAAAPGGSVFWAAADMTRSQKKPAKSQLLRLISTGSLAIGEQAGQVAGSVTLNCADTNTAASVQTIAQGFLAMALLTADAKDAKAQDFLHNISLQNDGRKISIGLRMPTADFIGQLEKKMLEEKTQRAKNEKAGAAPAKKT